MHCQLVDTLLDAVRSVLCSQVNHGLASRQLHWPVHRSTEGVACSAQGMGLALLHVTTHQLHGLWSCEGLTSTGGSTQVCTVWHPPTRCQRILMLSHLQLTECTCRFIA